MKPGKEMEESFYLYVSLRHGSAPTGADGSQQLDADEYRLRDEHHVYDWGALSIRPSVAL